MDARIAFLVSVALSFWGTGSALQCYSCSQGQPGCEDPFNKDNFTPIHTDGVCLKFIGLLNLVDRQKVGYGIWRGPVTQAYYDELVRNGVPERSDHFSKCSSDKCNPAARPAAAWTPLLLLLLPATAAFAAWRH